MPAIVHHHPSITQMDPIPDDEPLAMVVTASAHGKPYLHPQVDVMLLAT